MTRIAFALFTLAALSLAGVRPGVAETYRPWCADYGGSTNCGFHSYDQCRITASGQILGAYATHGTRDAVSTDGGGDEAEFMRHHGPESDAGRGLSGSGNKSMQ